jgi:FkbM family methyltransferase
MTGNSPDGRDTSRVRSAPLISRVELKALMALGRRIPVTFPRGYTLANRLNRHVYARKPRPPEVVDVLGITMELDPHEAIEGVMLIAPQLYEPAEMALLKGWLQPGDVFVDVGAHIGFVTLQAARVVGPTGKVLAIEAEPENFQRLRHNVALNPWAPVTPIHSGVSDRREVLPIAINTTGNRGGSSFVRDGPETVLISCRPLHAIVCDQHLDCIHAMKIDIEGMEGRVLQRFFEDASPSMWPRHMLIEYFLNQRDYHTGDIISILQSRGYEVNWQATLSLSILSRTGTR